MAIDGSATTIEVTPEAATKLIELRADDPKRPHLLILNTAAADPVLDPTNVREVLCQFKAAVGR